MIIRKYRIERGWSQEQLAEISGLSVRTIQRIERGSKASLDSIGAIASAFDVSISEISEDVSMYQAKEAPEDEQSALAYVREVKGFYEHAICFSMVISILVVTNWIITPDFFWVLWVVFGWGLGLVVHALSVFEVFGLFGANWEQRQIEKRLSKQRNRVSE